MRLVHLTDLHMTEPKGLARYLGKRYLGYLSWLQTRRFIHKRNILDSVTSAVIAERPDVVAITGDLVQLGLPGEIKEAELWLRNLAQMVKVCLVPGNHDIYSKSSIGLVADLWKPYIHLKGRCFPSEMEIGSVVVIGLCSAIPTPFWSAAGLIDPQQMERLDRLLRLHHDKFVCVLLHHPLTHYGISSRKQLKNFRELREVLSNYKVDLVLHGHMHSNKEYSLLPKTQIFCTASASSNKDGHLASYRIIDICSTEIKFEVSSCLKILDCETSEIRAVESSVWQTSKPARAS